MYQPQPAFQCAAGYDGMPATPLAQMLLLKKAAAGLATRILAALMHRLQASCGSFYSGAHCPARQRRQAHRISIC